MNYTENLNGIKIDVQAVDIHIADGVQQGIRDAIGKIGRHTREINFVDVYLKDEEAKSTNAKSISMRVGIPGPDVFAEDNGDQWASLLKNVTEKIIRQLEKVRY